MCAHFDLSTILLSRFAQSDKAMQLLPLVPENCDGCGLCCQGVGSPVLVYQTDRRWSGPHPFRPAGLPEELVQEIDEHFQGLMRGQEPQESCLWYDNHQKKCRHYAWRPAVCKGFELAGEECLRLWSKENPLKQLDQR